jgi:prephenate dehydrogenase
MEKIAVVGLGIIGASIAGALTATGYAVDGNDVQEETVALAVEYGYIQKRADDLTAYDAVFIAVPPTAAMELLDKTSFQDGAFVADICGVKACVEKVVYAKKRNYRYIGLHPMAGKETSGIASASPTLFQNANLVITLSPFTEEETLRQAKVFASAMGFSNVVECTAEEHDGKIALTSQLAHIVSNSYCKSDTINQKEGFCAGSFADMTRVGKLDVKLWTELFLANPDHLGDELGNLIQKLTEFKQAIDNKDEKTLSQLLKEGNDIKVQSLADEQKQKA